MTYWQQREITHRLQADRQRRHERNECDALDGLLDQLSPALVMAIAGELNGEEPLTLIPREWFED